MCSLTKQKFNSILVWSYMYSTELRREPSELPLLFLKKEDASRKEVETIQEILFEKFRVPILGMINQGIFRFLILEFTQH